MKEKVVSVLALFTSTGTLLCCALPAAIGAIAGGAAIGTLVSSFPWLIPLSNHKGWIFLIAGLLIATNGIFVMKPQGTLACAITGGKGCEVAGKFTRSMFGITVATYTIGAFMAYGVVPLLRLLET